MARDYTQHSAAGLGEARNVAARNAAEAASEAEAEQRAADEAAGSWLPWNTPEAHARAANAAREREAGWRAELIAIDAEVARRTPAERAEAQRADAQTGAARVERVQRQQDEAEVEAERMASDDWTDPRNWPRLIAAWGGEQLAGFVGLGPGQTIGERATAMVGALLLAAALGGGLWLLLELIESGQDISARNIEMLAPVVQRFG